MDPNNTGSPEVHQQSSQEQSSQEPSAESSRANSRRGSTTDGETKPRGRHRVRFNSTVNSNNSPLHNPESGTWTEDSTQTRLGVSKPLPSARSLVSDTHSGKRASLLGQDISLATVGATPLLARSVGKSPDRSSIRLPARSPTKQHVSGFSIGPPESTDLGDATDYLRGDGDDINSTDEKTTSQRTARSRAEILSRALRKEDSGHVHSASSSATGSAPGSPPGLPGRAVHIPLDDLNRRLMKKEKRNKFAIDEDTESEDEEDRSNPSKSRLRQLRKSVKNLIRAHHASGDSDSLFRVSAATDFGLDSGQITPIDNHGNPVEHSRKAIKYRRGVLGSLMKLYHDEVPGGFSSHENLLHRSAPTSPIASGSNTPRAKPAKWYKDESNHSSSASLFAKATTALAEPGASPAMNQSRPTTNRSRSSTTFDRIPLPGKKRKQKSEEVVHIRFHIEEQVVRYNYLVKLCKALMQFGAPSHRLEEYMRMSARVLEINGKFLFIPGCMLISFEDPSTFTSDVRIVRTDHAVDLGKLQDMHDIYKWVVHDRMGAREATEALDELSSKKPKYNEWVLVLFYGLASACVGPFAFEARFIDLPIAFMLGCLLGVMKIILAPRSELYSNVLEVTAAVVTSFLARVFGSIQGGDLFCFSALAQSSIALILPGFIVLCGALELQSRNIVAGSVRMVYAIIYSLFLGFGITIGTSIYGGIDQRATSEVTCRRPQSTYWSFLFVPLFTLCLIVINQGKLKQMPVMVVISLAGYAVNHFSALKFPSNVQVSQTLGALAIGLMGNVYSRFFHGLSAAALLPAIFVQVPSGLAASGSLISGIASANQITNSTNGTTTVSNGTQAGNTSIDINSTVFNVGYSMIQIAIGITVGLFFSSLLIYPFGKKRSGLFSF